MVQPGRSKYIVEPQGALFVSNPNFMLKNIKEVRRVWALSRERFKKGHKSKLPVEDLAQKCNQAVDPVQL